MISQYDKAPLVSDEMSIFGEVWEGDDFDLPPIFQEESSSMRHSRSPDTNDFIRYITPEHGTWFVVLFAQQNFEDVVIRADFEYSPTNTEPESAVELFDGENNGPWDSTDEIHEYHFFIEVPSLGPWSAS